METAHLLVSGTDKDGEPKEECVLQDERRVEYAHGGASGKRLGGFASQRRAD